MSETIKSAPLNLEMLVLGAMLNSAENASIGLKLVHNDNFFEQKHKTILKAMKDIYHEKKVVDVSLVANHLKINNTLGDIGGVPYLIKLPQYAGTSVHIEAYCEDLKKETSKRDLITLHNSLGTDLKQGADPSNIIAKLNAKLNGIKSATLSFATYKHILEANSLKQITEELKNISSDIRTGLYINGEPLELPGGALTIVAAPTSHGKTTFLINLAHGVIKQYPNKKVIFISYEEARASILTLFINSWIELDFSANNRKSIRHYLRTGSVEYVRKDDDTRDLFVRNIKAFEDIVLTPGRLHVNYSDMIAEHLVNAIRYIKNEVSDAVVFVDYMQFLRSKSGGRSRQEELKDICLQLKDCAVDTGLPIVLAAQFNREVICEADLSPTKIGEAGDIERAANLILGFWNRNFEGFGREGNKGKNGKIIPKESALYVEIMKRRGDNVCINDVLDFNGNTGKITNRISKPTANHKLQSPPAHKG